MKHAFTLIVLIGSFLLVSHFSFATIKTASNGNWNAPGTWLPAGVPACGDTIIIPAGVSVHIAANVDLNTMKGPLCAATYLDVAGRLTFANGRKIRMTAGACINVSLGGEIHPSGVGAGASELIEIDKVNWWQAKDGVLVGDQVTGVKLGCAVALPIELAAYSIQAIDNKVVVNFTTASERDIEYYILEASRDGSYWQEVTTLDAVGNSSIESSYQLEDKNPFNGVSYYRLKFVNINGAVVVMEILSVEVYALKYLVYPIPVHKTMFLEGEDLADSKISVINSLGENVEVSKSLIYDKYSFNFEQIKSGVYFVVIETEKTKRTERVVVVHKEQ